MTPSSKHPNLVVHTQSPFNGGPPLQLLREHFITPSSNFYVRSHGSVPAVDSNQYRLSVNGLVRQPLSLSLSQLQTQFPKHQVMATLQCAGNRRQELNSIARVLGGVPWGAEAIGNAVWGGAALKDVLDLAGLEPGASHAVFTGLDPAEHDHGNFGGSIPLAKALTPDVLLAYEMNGQPLPPDHGFPLRVIAPGYIGARSVKWLAEIRLQASPSSNYYQSQTYKLYPPHITAETAAQVQGLSIGEFSINAAICVPHESQTVPAGRVQVQGYAITGGRRRVARVDVSADGGRHWATAMLIDNDQAWAWCFWECELELAPGEHRLMVRAWDTAANTQPESLTTVWNYQGYMNNAWHHVNIHCIA